MTLRPGQSRRPHRACSGGASRGIQHRADRAVHACLSRLATSKSKLCDLAGASACGECPAIFQPGRPNHYRYRRLFPSEAGATNGYHDRRHLRTDRRDSQPGLDHTGTGEHRWRHPDRSPWRRRGADRPIAPGIVYTDDSRKQRPGCVEHHEQRASAPGRGQVPGHRACHQLHDRLTGWAASAAGGFCQVTRAVSTL